MGCAILQMKTHGWEVNAVFNKKFSSFALYGGKESENLRPYQVSSKFRPRELDKKFIEGLRKWFVNFQLDEGILKIKLISLSNDFIPHLYLLSLWSHYQRYCYAEAIYCLNPYINTHLEFLLWLLWCRLLAWKLKPFFFFLLVMETFECSFEIIKYEIWMLVSFFFFVLDVLRIRLKGGGGCFNWLLWNYLLHF